ncbi:hypothetical protein QBC37DRAFT_429560 [Rhypophila decipiens]|uniref:Uncharacterized protein n=1 Tax=Rhypophila decipiens TaxID=261697 RepID=A0AAN7B4G1_9PEZI|nr:hypothetical protein QBC37DRAFT_429560 [Rhypophila decipiens]
MSSFSGKTYPTLAESLSNQLTKYQLRQWGFVIIRTTYSSEAKWPEFLAIVNDGIRSWFLRPQNEARWYDLYDRHVMTVLQDAATLSDANLALTARVFTDWITSPEAQAEREGTKICDRFMFSPRYHFYIHADEATVEQVLDQHAKRKAAPEDSPSRRSRFLYENENLFTVRIVGVSQVMSYQSEIIKEQGPDANTDVIEEEQDEYELLDMVKRMKVLDIPDLYSVLGDSLDRWYNIYTKGDVCQV